MQLDIDAAQQGAASFDTGLLLRDFHQVASLAGAEVQESDIEVETLHAPHRPPTKLPTGTMAVYVFAYGKIVLKVGKAGPRSNARYTSQHYNPSSAPSTLAASLFRHGGEIGIPDLPLESVGDWIRKNTDRVNFILNLECGISALTLLESYLQCRLNPVFEGLRARVDAYAANRQRSVMPFAFAKATPARLCR